MIDIKFIRENPGMVKKGLQKKGSKVDIGELLENEKKKIVLKMKELDSGNDRLDKDLKELDRKLEEILLKIPNLPLDTVPEGRDERDNVVLEKIGEKPDFGFKPKDYMEIGEKLDLIDVKRAAKVSGTRFGFLRNEAVLLEFALIRFVLEKLTKEGFIPVVPP